MTRLSVSKGQLHENVAFTVDAEIFGGGEPLEQVRLDGLKEQERAVECDGQVGESIVWYVRVGDDTHDGGIVDLYNISPCLFRLRLELHSRRVLSVY